VVPASYNHRELHTVTPDISSINLEDEGLLNLSDVNHHFQFFFFFFFFFFLCVMLLSVILVKFKKKKKIRKISLKIIVWNL
jgi:hypothetical protein